MTKMLISSLFKIKLDDCKIISDVQNLPVAKSISYLKFWFDAAHLGRAY